MLRMVPCAGLGLAFSDRMGFLASWWHCDEDHHGIALTFAPRLRCFDLAAPASAVEQGCDEVGAERVDDAARVGAGVDEFVENATAFHRDRLR